MNSCVDTWSHLVELFKEVVGGGAGGRLGGFKRYLQFPVISSASWLRVKMRALSCSFVPPS